jgi:hypothetical protein
MQIRTCLLVMLLATPAWSDEPAAETSQPAVQSFDLRSDTIKKIVHDTASTQYANVQLAQISPVKSEAEELRYVPPEKPEAPVREPPRELPASSSPSSGFLSAAFDILFDELLGTSDVDEVTASNDMLRCRVQKDLKTSPPGPDNCPNVY